MADVKDVANLFLHLAEEQARLQDGELMTDMKLQKMLYFAQCWHLVRHDVPLFSSVIEAWEHGPVVPSVYSEYKVYKANPIPAKPVDYSAFTPEEMDTIMDVFTYYDRYSASGLRELSHEDGSPWNEVYDPQKRNISISEQQMKDFYRKQRPLESFRDRFLRFSEKHGIHVYTPSINHEGHLILPEEEYEDWGEWDDN